jgi:hypothetical protein
MLRANHCLSLALRDRPRFNGELSLSGDTGHRTIFEKDGSVARDPKRASLWRCIKRLDAYSITLSARESSVSGTLRPSA